MTGPTAPAGASHAKPAKLPATVRKRDALVRKIVGKGKLLSQRLLAYREKSLADIFALAEDTRKRFGFQLTHGIRGSIDLYSHDGSLKIEVRKDDKIAFNEELAVVQAEILRVAKSWVTSSDNENLVIAVTEVCAPGRGGKLSAQRILGLQRWKIKDPEWKVCMEYLRKAMQVVTLRRAGATKKAAIEQVFGVKKGGSAGYRRASLLVNALYDALPPDEPDDDPDIGPFGIYLGA
jgi:hypothetical protein